MALAPATTPGGAATNGGAAGGAGAGGAKHSTAWYLFTASSNLFISAAGAGLLSYPLAANHEGIVTVRGA